MVNIISFEKVCKSDVPTVGGKNASLGEMLQNLTNLGVKVPTGFAVTAEAFMNFLEHNKIKQFIDEKLVDLDVEDIDALRKAGKEIRQTVLDASLVSDCKKEIADAYQELCVKHPKASVAVRSSATAEDLADASFAGQQETYLNVKGIDDLYTAIKKVYASLYTDRAIAYRVHQGFKHEGVAISVGIQLMVRSDIAASGVMFSLDTESGFDQVVLITGSYGLGESIVQGKVNPDEFIVYKPNLKSGHTPILNRHLGSKLTKMVYSKAGSEEPVEFCDVDVNDRNKFCLTDDEIKTLAEYAVSIEKHYKCPMDIEWAKDGESNELFIVQARPETVQSQRKKNVRESYTLKNRGTVLAEGRSVGNKIGTGPTKVINDSSEMSRFEDGDILVADITDPDMEPIMKRASAIVTARGGRTSHAAIISRELGIPAVVGCGSTIKKIKEGINVTVSCAEGDTGYVYDGELAFDVSSTQLGDLPEIPVKIMLNVGNPERSFAFSQVPNSGVGLARLEFIIANYINLHPKAALEPEALPKDVQEKIAQRCMGYASPRDFYIDRLTEGVATIAASFNPNPVIVRLSDFKSNEYACLVGGESFEPDEENPMLGFRGASRYIAKSFQKCFELECIAMKRIREDYNLKNVQLMIPFVRTLEEAKAVIDLLASFGLERGKDGLKIIMMCELPSNVILADEFLEYFDGFSIGSNDLTQLTLGLDRDSALISDKFDERNPAIKRLLERAISACKKANKYVGICGQGPSDHPDLAEWLVEQGIDSISLNPDSVLETHLKIGKAFQGEKIC